jgi:hypothetical protein
MPFLRPAFGTIGDGTTWNDEWVGSSVMPPHTSCCSSRANVWVDGLLAARAAADSQLGAVLGYPMDGGSDSLGKDA